MRLVTKTASWPNSTEITGLAPVSVRNDRKMPYPRTRDEPTRISITISAASVKLFTIRSAGGVASPQDRPGKAQEDHRVAHPKDMSARAAIPKGRADDQDYIRAAQDDRGHPANVEGRHVHVLPQLRQPIRFLNQVAIQARRPAARGVSVRIAVDAVPRVPSVQQEARQQAPAGFFHQQKRHDAHVYNQCERDWPSEPPCSPKAAFAARPGLTPSLTRRHRLPSFQLLLQHV
eukprot:scaffold434_cov186-Pinguiococcus_pyrenoidosus.AAC.154